MIADKLNAIRADNLYDGSGYPRVAATFGGGGTPTYYMGTFPALPSGLEGDRFRFRVGPGGEVLSLGASLWRVLAPGLYRRLGHAALRLCNFPGCQSRSLGGGRRRVAATRRRASAA